MPDSATAYVVRYTITPEGAVDAGRFLQANAYRFVTLATVMGLVATVGVGVLAVLDGPPILLWFAIGFLVWTTLFAVFLSRPALAWRARRNGRSVMGGVSELRFDDAGVAFSHPAASGQFLWSQMTGLRANSSTVLFVRDRLLLFYIPTSAFVDTTEQAEVLAFASAHIAAAQR